MAGPSPVSPSSQAPKWHMTLTDGTDVLGFVLHNQQGRRDETAKRRYPLRPEAIKIQQGESEYSDNDPKFTALVQNDWSGGRGAHRFETDKTRFAESEGLDTTGQGMVTLGAGINYGIGYRGSHQLLDNSSYLGVQVLDTSEGGAGRYVAQKFTCPAHLTSIKNIRIYRKTYGEPSELGVAIYNDVAGSPGTLQRGTTIGSPSGGTLGSDLSFLDATFTTALTVTPGTSYWVVVYATAGDDFSNYWQVLGITHEGTTKYSDDGSSWLATVNFDLQYRLTDANDPFIARFFEYKGQLYFFADYDTEKASALYMNGWRGAADSNTGNLDRLVDASQDFSVSHFDAKEVRILTGEGSAYEFPDWRKVSTNGGQSGYITITPDWKKEHATTDDYAVLGSDYWQSITLPANGWTTDPVTDVAVDNDTVWIAKGNLAYAWRHRQYNNLGTWDAGSGTDNWHMIVLQADKLAIHSDPVLGSVLYASQEVATELRPQLEKLRAPYGWQNNYGPVQLWAGKNTSPTWASDDATYVTVTNLPAEKKVKVVIKQGVITGGTVSAGGTDYQVNDVVTVTELTSPTNYYSGSSGGNATFKVTAVDGGTGEVTAITLLDGGFDYSDGVRATTGGAGTGLTISISTSGFGTGLAAHLNLSTELDGRQTTKLSTYLQSVNVTLAQSAIDFTLDNTAGAGSPFIQAASPLLKSGKNTLFNFEYDAEDYDDIAAINALGIEVVDGTKTMEIHVVFGAWLLGEFDPIPLGEATERINKLLVYGDPKTLWVLSDRNIYELRGGNAIPIQLEEIRQVRSWMNGTAAVVNDVYLYTNLGGDHGFHRYYRQQLENVSPKTDYIEDAWLYKGQIASGLSYAGRVYVGTDGTYGRNWRKSRMLTFEGRAWHEVYTSGKATGGEKIRSMYVQPLESTADRLWFSNGPDVMWMPVNIDGTPRIDINNNDFYRRPEGWVETAWIYTGKVALNKVFHTLTLFTEGITSGNLSGIDVFYKADKETTWTEVGEVTTSPTQELDIRTSSSGFVKAKRIKFKFRLKGSGSTAPYLTAWVLNYYAIEPTKYGYVWTTLLTEKDLSINLEGDQDLTCGYASTAEAALAKLDQWSEETTPLTQNSVFSVYDAKTVTLKHTPSQAFKVLPDEQIESHIVQINTEVL